MFRHTITEKVSARTYVDWAILTFIAGNLNAGGFLACNRFVSHITGFATLAGVDMAHGWVGQSIGNLSIPLFFLMGVIFSAYLTEKRHAQKKEGQRFAPVMGLVTFLLLVITIGGTLGWFGAFGEPANLKYDYVFLALLCGACGLQNAAITSASGATIRTTHLTGLTTDLGLGIVRAEIAARSPDSRLLERRANLFRFMTILAFFVGSMVGALAFIRYQYNGFIIPALLAFYSAVRAR